MTDEPHRRANDRWDIVLSESAERFWDFIDKRQIAQHLVSLAILWGTVRVLEWAMAFANTSTLPGVERGAVIASVLAPYSALQAAAISFFFKART